MPSMIVMSKTHESAHDIINDIPWFSMNFHAIQFSSSSPSSQKNSKLPDVPISGCLDLGYLEVVDRSAEAELLAGPHLPQPQLHCVGVHLARLRGGMSLRVGAGPHGAAEFVPGDLDRRRKKHGLPGLVNSPKKRIWKDPPCYKAAING